MQVHDAFDPLHRLSYLLGLGSKNFQVSTEDAHHDGLARTCQYLADSFLEVGLQIAVQPGIPLHHLVDGRDCLVVVCRRVDTDPVLAEVDAHHLIGGKGLTNVGPEVAHAGNGPKFLAGPRRDAHHLGVRGARVRDPVHQKVAFLEVR